MKINFFICYKDLFPWCKIRKKKDTENKKVSRRKRLLLFFACFLKTLAAKRFIYIGFTQYHQVVIFYGSM